jgi:rhodanese-related sulfurtransferase
MQVIQPGKLKQRLDGEPPLPLLLDVREPVEYAFCHLEGSLLIPMNEVPSRLGELDPEQEIVVLCHHGVRSSQVAHFLDQQGFRRVVNLTGGLDAWAVQVDPRMPRY